MSKLNDVFVVIGVAFITIALIAGIMALPALLVMFAWNYALAGPFQLPQLHFLQTWCILFLAGTAFRLVFGTRDK